MKVGTTQHTNPGTELIIKFNTDPRDIIQWGQDAADLLYGPQIAESRLPKYSDVAVLNDEQELYGVTKRIKFKVTRYKQTSYYLGIV